MTNLQLLELIFFILIIAIITISILLIREHLEKQKKNDNNATNHKGDISEKEFPFVSNSWTEPLPEKRNLEPKVFSKSYQSPWTNTIKKH
ncbi:hypothetical protein [Methanobrevibacter filiformis]|uniref:Uncharacterized protein n=1 Tax=Methanobrevibacter filiformis TaxID=55758 RepID=A0A166E8M1_9EURY|nr:hypothetical protein [Methanobrevibacter filiformis]KZX16393.1 hypothetical protein MBFIL_05200 [Methanobrevibacter filiformis]